MIFSFKSIFHLFKEIKSSVHVIENTPTHAAEPWGPDSMERESCQKFEFLLSSFWDNGTTATTFFTLYKQWKNS